MANLIRERTGEIIGAEKFVVDGGANFGGSPVAISLLSDNIQELKNAKSELMQKLAQNPKLTDIASNDPEIENMLASMVIIVDPMMNPDGRDRFTKSLEQYRGTAPNYDDQSLIHTGDWPYGRTNHYYFDLNRDCIKAITFSLSKAFYGAERVRIGIRCKKEYNDDPVDLFTSMGMLSKISAGVGLELCNEFSPDYNHEKYRLSQIDICKKLNIEPSDCVQFGITDKSHKDFGDYDRGSRWRRVCISKLLSDMGDEYE